MEHFDDLSSTDLLDLTEADLENWIDRTCAKEGLPLLPPNPGPKPAVEQVPKSNTALKLDVPYDTYFQKEDMLQVEKAIAILNSLTTLTATYVETTYSGPAFLKVTHVDKTHCRYVDFYTEEEVSKSIEIDAIFGPKIDSHKKAQQIYDKAVKERKEVVDRIHGKVQLANDDYAAYLALSKSWDKYLDLADDDEAIADKYFLNYYGEANHRRVRPAYYINKAVAPEIIEAEL